MNPALEQQWRSLCAKVDAARVAFDRAHDEMVNFVQNDGATGRTLMQYCQAHDQAAEQWMEARRTLIRFCKDHPDICKSHDEQSPTA